MRKVTIWLDDQTDMLVRKAARSQGVPLSQWIVSALRAASAPEWPQEVLDLEGAWQDFPELQELRRE